MSPSRPCAACAAEAEAAETGGSAAPLQSYARFITVIRDCQESLTPPYSPASRAASRNPARALAGAGTRRSSVLGSDRVLQSVRSRTGKPRWWRRRRRRRQRRRSLPAAAAP